MVVLLRWVLIIATSYLLLFSSEGEWRSTAIAAFVAAYLASNLVLSRYFRRWRHHRWFDTGVVLFDLAAVVTGLALSGAAAGDFFPVFFLMVFIGALTERLGLVVGAAMLIGVVHLATLAQHLGTEEILDPRYVMRVPFLFVVALFLGFEVRAVRARERNERARERRRLVTESLAAVTHDLKNPLGVIQSLASILLEGGTGPLTADQAGLVRRIHASARRLLQLASNLLDVARIEAGRLDLHRVPTDLRDVIEDALALAHSGADLKGVTLRHVTDGALPAVAADALHIERAVSNLLDNAIKYTPPGGSVTVSTAACGDGVVLTVTDDGPGIPAAELASLFERYRRRAQSHRVQGTGLGLFIVKAIVEAHGGDVALASVEGRGTTVTIRLPAAGGAAAAAPVTQPAAEAPAWAPVMPVDASVAAAR